MRWYLLNALSVITIWFIQKLIKTAVTVVAIRVYMQMLSGPLVNETLFQYVSDFNTPMPLS